MAISRTEQNTLQISCYSCVPLVLFWGPLPHHTFHRKDFIDSWWFFKTLTIHRPVVYLTQETVNNRRPLQILRIAFPPCILFITLSDKISKLKEDYFSWISSSQTKGLFWHVCCRQRVVPASPLSSYLKVSLHSLYWEPSWCSPTTTYFLHGAIKPCRLISCHTRRVRRHKEPDFCFPFLRNKSL